MSDFKTVKKPQVMLFVGAGASARLGMPTTLQFIDLLRKHWNSDETLRFLKSYKQYYASNNTSKVNTKTPPEDSEYLRDWLLELRRAAESIQELPDIKTTVVTNKAHRPQAASLYVNNILKDFDLFTRNTYKEIEPEIAYMHYDLLFDIFASFDINEIPVFTTNYDLVFESMPKCSKCKWDIVTGARATGTNLILDTNQFEKQKSFPTILLYKLHGSTNWWFNKEKNEIEVIPHQYGAPSDYSEVMIYPTRNKFEQRKEYPFSFYYDRLKSTLSSEETHLCIAIGYSFRDKPINEMFKESLKKGLNLVVFDRNARKDQLLNEMEIKEDESICSRIKLTNIEFGNWHDARNKIVFSNTLTKELEGILGNNNI